EPGHVRLDPRPECLLAGLVDVVPELAEPGEAQVLVGHPACAVIDHEDESAGQQQEAYQSEEPADHASPKYCKAPLKCRQPIPGRREKFNLFSPLSPPPSRALRPRLDPEDVDAC